MSVLVTASAPSAPTTRTRVLLGCGAVGFPVFVTVSLRFAATRSDHHPLRDHVSSLSEGPRGWVQRLNFVGWGLLTAAYAGGLRRVLGHRTAAGRWVPRLAGVSAAGMVTIGAYAEPSTRHRTHLAATSASYIALPSAALLLAPHFARHREWRGWATYSVTSAVAMWVLGATAGATMGRSPSGLCERLSIAAMGSWSAVLAARLLAGTPAPVGPRSGAGSP